MKCRMGQIKEIIVRNKWFLIGFLLITLYVFSNFFYGYKLSFTNANYYFPPFDSMEVETKGPLLTDIADSMYPTIYKNYYSEAGPSFWDSDIALGGTTNVVAQYINPLRWVYVLPFEMAIFFKCMTEFAIGFFAMYLFMRSIGVEKYASAMTGVIYTFSSVIVVWMGWSHSDVAVIAPLLFYAIEKLMSTMKVKYMLLVALSVYLMLIVGMPTYAAYFMYLAGVYIVVFTCIRHWKNKRNIFMIGGMFALGVVLATLASLPYTYTLLSTVGSNGYSDSRLSYATHTLGWEYIRTFLFPYVRSGLDIHINESTLYAGVVAVVLLPFVFINNRKKKRNLFFLSSSLVLVILIFTHALDFAYQKLPMINTSLKFRVITLLMFTLAVITGISLNDILNNKEDYRKKKWFLVLWAVWMVGVIYVSTTGIGEKYEDTIRTVIICTVLLAGCVILLLKKDYKIVYVVLASVILLDSGTFAQSYLPWISAEAEVIPEATDSVSYLMEGTKGEERIVGIGNWTFFPNTPSFYELNDIRAHGFEATNRDMKNYYRAIAENAYDSTTRISFKHIDNYELLKYLGVKYIYGEFLSEEVPIGNENVNSKVFGPIPSNTSITQDIYLEKNPRVISILIATYGKIPQSGGYLKVSLIAKETETLICEKNIPVTDLCDNSLVHLAMPEETEVLDGKYQLTLSVDDLGADQITVWMKEDETAKVIGSETEVSGSMVLFAEYDTEEFHIVSTGLDGLKIAQLDTYADKAELIEQVLVFETEADVLDAMSQKYQKQTLFLVGDESEAYNAPLSPEEQVEVLEYGDDYVKLSCTTKEERYVSLNDYYNKDWVAYIDGEEVEVEKANYLLRAVKVPAGEDLVIEFVYEPDAYITITVCSAAVIAATWILFLFRKKLQVAVDRIKRD